jgi:hypothetical protein
MNIPAWLLVVGGAAGLLIWKNRYAVAPAANPNAPAPQQVLPANSINQPNFRSPAWRPNNAAWLMPWDDNADMTYYGPWNPANPLASSSPTAVMAPIPPTGSDPGARDAPGANIQGTQYTQYPGGAQPRMYWRGFPNKTAIQGDPGYIVDSTFQVNSAPPAAAPNTGSLQG